MRYLLDSGTATDIFDVSSPAHPRLTNRITTLHDEDEICVSILTHCELEYSFENAEDAVKPKIRKEIESILREFTVLPLQGSVARHYGRLKSALKQRLGISKFNIKRHNIDLLLAATALEEDCVLVSGDMIFNELKTIVPALEFESW